MLKKKKGKKDFSINSALKFGWNVSKKNWKVLLIVSIIYLTVITLEVVGEYLLKEGQADPVFKGLLVFCLIMLKFPMRIWLDAGMVVIALRFTESKEVILEDLFPSLKKTLKLFAGSVMVATVALLGFFLLVIPGVIWLIKYGFVPYLMLDKGLRMGQAFKVSSKMTDGLKWKLFGFGICLVGIELLGLLVLMVGVLWANLVTGIATVYVYKKLLMQTNRSLRLKVA